MWCFLTFGVLLPTTLSKGLDMFRNDRIIFKSDYNITRLLVPSYGKFDASNDMPLVFFTASGPDIVEDTTVFVLDHLTAYEILPGGRDITKDYSSDKAVYIASANDIFVYDPESQLKKIYTTFKYDKIVQMQKATGSEVFYVLTEGKELFKIHDKGKTKTKIPSVKCALDFVLDTSNNIYYVACKHKIIHIIRNSGKKRNRALQYLDSFDDVKLLRPAFVMQESIPVIGDGTLYIIYSNTSSKRIDFTLKERPTAYSVDMAVNLFAAFDGNIYEFHASEVLKTSVFGFINEWPQEQESSRNDTSAKRDHL